MIPHLTAPAWLLLALPIAWLLWDAQRRVQLARRDARRTLGLIFRSLALLSLLLALAGLRVSALGRPVRLLALVDQSQSLYDQAAQEAAAGRLRDWAAGRSDREVQVGVAIFARGTPVLLREIDSVSTSESQGGSKEHSGWPNLLHPSVTLDTGGTDIGGAIEFARAQLASKDPSARAILLLSDGLDTEDRAALAASGLAGSGIDLLAWPSPMGGTGDVCLAGLQAPENARSGRGLPLEATVLAQRAGEVKVVLERRSAEGLQPCASSILRLGGSSESETGPFRATVTLIDPEPTPGIAIYKAHLEGAARPTLPDDFQANNALWTAVRVAGPARWAALARPDSTLAHWAAAALRPLGVSLTLFTPGRLPLSADAYRNFSGVLVDGLSAEELPPDGPALNALESAGRTGLSLVAVGGPRAFGAGGHPEGGAWERLLPVTFRPEDDRTRTILFVVDVSESMSQPMPSGTKLRYACDRLAQVVGRLSASDRVGLVTFSGQARVACPSASDPARVEFIRALEALRIENLTDFGAALETTAQALEKDNSEERVVVLLSDGDQQPARPWEELQTLVRRLTPPPDQAGAPRRTVLHTFGIGREPGELEPAQEAFLAKLAAEGGGRFFPRFEELGGNLAQVIDRPRPDLYARQEAFQAQLDSSYPVLAAAGQPWPNLGFRNRVRARASAERLAWSTPQSGAGALGSRAPDPLLVCGQVGLARRAVLALGLDGPGAENFLAPSGTWKGGRALLAALLSWAEGDASAPGSSLRADLLPGGTLRARMEVQDPATHLPVHELSPVGRLSKVADPGGQEISPDAARSDLERPLWPVAPGRYEGEFSGLSEGVYRLAVREPARGVELECFVTAPYPPELRRFGSDRQALTRWTQQAGGHSRLLNLIPQDLDAWLDSVERRRQNEPARPILVILAAVFLLLEVAARGGHFKSKNGLPPQN